MTKSELIESITKKQSIMPAADVEAAVKTIIDYMIESLANGKRIEIRNFGIFSLHFRAAKLGRNPKTGKSVAIPSRYLPHFKSGLEMSERVNSLNNGIEPPTSAL